MCYLKGDASKIPPKPVEGLLAGVCVKFEGEKH